MTELVRDATGEDLTAARICALFALQYAPPEWACFEELRCGTGISQEQRLDLFALNLWPSNRWRSLAVEVKVSRADFLREVRAPGKRAFAESVARECYFATPAGLVKVDEVPDGWGLIEVGVGGLRTRKAAMQRVLAPWPMHFSAAIARRTSDARPTAGKTAWLHAGRVLDEEALLAVAREAGSHNAESVRYVAEREGKESVYESADYKALVALRTAAADLTGHYRPTAEDLRAWAAHSGGGLDGRQVDRLRDAHTAIGALLGNLDGEQHG